MTVLFKVPPPDAGMEDTLVLSAKPYENASMAPGDRAFVWWSETQGGTGLAARGVVTEAFRKGPLWQAKIKVSSEAGRRFGKEDLRPLRDSKSHEPQATLARKLYRHSLDKVTNLDPVEERFLDSFF